MPTLPRESSSFSVLRRRAPSATLFPYTTLFRSGGYVTDAVPPPLHSATAVQIAEAVRIGPYVMPSFSERTISNADLDSLIRYVEWTKSPDDRGGWSLGHVGPVPEGLVTLFLAASVLVALCMLLGKRLRG